jgi:ribosomal protein L11 methyltransferase
MSSIKLVWQGDKTYCEQLAEALSGKLSPPADAIALQKADPIEEDEDSEWQIEIYFSKTPDDASLGAVFASLGLPFSEPHTETLPDIDWVAHSLEGLGVIEAGRFVLYGIHDADKLPQGQDRITIRIDANLAFGTGHHPTTSGCLKALGKIGGDAPDYRPQNILDLGTGSAVLAIAAVKLWDSPVLATDLDADSVDIAAHNAVQNKVKGIQFICADGFSHDRISAAAPFDFIFANILAGPLIELAAPMATHCQKGALVILAGLLTRQEQDVITAYEAAGFTLINRLDQETWPVLTFQL